MTENKMFKLTATIESRTDKWTEIHNGTAEGIELVKQTIRGSAVPGSMIDFKVEASNDPNFY